MAKPYSARDELAPGWYTPGRLLLLLCILNAAIYIDRGSFASNSVNGSRQQPSGFQVTSTPILLALLAGLSSARPVSRSPCTLTVTPSDCMVHAR